MIENVLSVKASIEYNTKLQNDIIEIIRSNIITRIKKYFYCKGDFLPDTIMLVFDDDELFTNLESCYLRSKSNRRKLGQIVAADITNQLHDGGWSTRASYQYKEGGFFTKDRLVLKHV